MQGKYKMKKCSSGIKKIKKYDLGTQAVELDVNGNPIDKRVNKESGASQAAGQGIEKAVGSIPIAGAFMAAGKAGYGAIRQEDEYGVAKSDTQAEVASVLAPHKATMRSFQEGRIGEGLLALTPFNPIVAGKQNQRDKQAREVAKMNEGIVKANSNVQTDLTSFQAKQYKLGGKTAKSKLIEIEGKKTPEIHTDANFNVKNLGTIPHSKGGNKVLAEEGDVVFPTQNSPKKYNEIMNAIMKKDKYKLKKEQNKLPEDKATKAKYGLQVGGDDERPINPFDDVPVLWNKLMKFDKSLDRGSNSESTNGASVKAPYGSYQPTTKGLTGNSGYHPLGKGKTQPKKNTKGAAKGSRPVGKAVVAPKPFVNDVATDLTGIENTKDTGYDKLVNSAYSKPDVEKEQTVLSGGKEEKKKGKKMDANSLMELAPIAYNLGQGLFGKTEKVNRREFNPELEKYVDTSANMRREINNGYKTNLANARNLSGGLGSNIRANSQAASNAKLAQVNSIDSQEYGKQLDVNNRNTGLINNAKLTNLELNNKYDELDAMNRGVKSNALTQGLTDLGALGSRNTLQKNQLAAQKDAVGLLSGNTSYRTTVDDDGHTSGIEFNQPRPVASFENNLFPKLGVGKKSKRTYSKGSKTIQVERKYKLR